MNDRIIRLKTVAQMLGVSRATVYEKLKAGGKYYAEELPKPLRIGARSVGFSENQLQAYIATRALAHANHAA